MEFSFSTQVMKSGRAPTRPHDALSDSLYGEYARMLLVSTAGCSVPAAATMIGSDPLTAWLMIENDLVLVTTWFAGMVRCVVLVTFAAALSWFTHHSTDSQAVTLLGIAWITIPCGNGWPALGDAVQRKSLYLLSPK